MDAPALVLSLSMIAALSGVCDTYIPYEDEEKSCRSPLHESQSSVAGLRASCPAGSAHVLKDLQAAEW